MYQTGLVAVIKVNGKVLREDKDAVLLPFGSEYSILIKNLKSQRVMVKVAVDGTDATDGTRLVIPANSEIELERFIKSGNLSQGNRFKFIQRTEEIEEFRGIKADDGLIRIEYWTETPQAYITPAITYTYPNWKPGPNYYGGQYVNSSKSFRSFDSIDSGNSVMRSATPRGITGSSLTSSFAAQNFVAQMDTSDNGITVPGSVSNQQFTSVNSFPVSAESEVLILKLRGRFESKPIQKPVLVSTRLTCPTCGKRSDSTVRFCPQCGTSLHIV